MYHQSMPSTISKLLRSVGLKPSAAPVRWGADVPLRAPGVYIVSMSKSASSNKRTRRRPPFDLSKFTAWIQRAPALRIDGAVCDDPKLLRNRLASFWMPDETILYIGVTTALVSKRLRAFYRTSLGKRGPHAGGHWIKTLTILGDTYVHFAQTANGKEAETKERALIEAFARCVSSATKRRL